MSPIAIGVVFCIAWWLIFFMALPFGVRTPDNPETGHASSAPEKPRLWLKGAITSVLAVLVTVMTWWVIDSGVIQLRPEDDLVEMRQQE